MNVFFTIVGIAGIGILTVLTYFLKDLPRLYRALKVEEVKATNSMELQREAYFRQISGKDLSKLFQDWTAVLYDLDRKMKGFGEKQAIDLISRTVIYGSSKTVGICSEYFKHVYRADAKKQDTEEFKSYDACMQILFIAHIVSSLKFDFTGYYIEPIKLLELKINDLEDTKKLEVFKKALSDIEKIVRDLDKRGE